MTPVESPAGAGADLVEVACDLCGSADADHRYSLQQSNIVTCRQCGFTYLTPRIPESLIYEKLQRWAEQDVVDAERLRIAFDEGTLALYNRYIGSIERWVQSDGRHMLDIGCSTGAFMKAAADRGWSVEGLEFGLASAAYVREALKCPVHNVSLYAIDLPPESFDAIILLEVIEHLVSPSEALKRIYRWLKPGGVLLVSTPNFDSLHRRVHGTRWWVINCEDEHIMLFAPHTLRAALEGAGFEVLRKRVRSIDVAGIVRQIRHKDDAPRERAVPEAAVMGQGYYESRATKEQLKKLLRRLGLLGGVRQGLRFLEIPFSFRGSPVYAMGDQLVFFARKPRP